MRGRKIFADLSLFVLLYNTNFMNKLKFNDFYLKLITKNNLLKVQIKIKIKISRKFHEITKTKISQALHVGVE